MSETETEKQEEQLPPMTEAEANQYEADGLITPSESERLQGK
jgi:hypothetical protein